MSTDSKTSVINLEQLSYSTLSNAELLSSKLGYALVLKYNFIHNHPYLLKFQASSTKESILQIKILRDSENVIIDSIPIYPAVQSYESLFYSYYSDQLTLELVSVDKDPKVIASFKNLKIISMRDLPDIGLSLDPGSQHFRAFVARPARYDLNGSNQFSLLTHLDLRDYKYVLDIGCGSLNLGRLLIPFLLPNRYFGVDPNKWLVEEGIKSNLGYEIIKLKNPRFQYVSNFEFYNFDREFDFIIAHSIFSHATPNQIELCLIEAKKVMNEDSVFVASFVKGEDSFKDYWNYPDCWSYTSDHLKNIISKCGLYCKELSWKHAGVQTWMAITKNLTKLENIDL